MAGFDFGIFRAPGVRRSRLEGSVYRYWSSFALADVLSRRLKGTVNVLDAGGRDGGTLELLGNLGLSGRYTCLDLEPTLVSGHRGRFEVRAIRSPFGSFTPTSQYDLVLFESSLECVGDYREVAWLADCLKPGGIVLVTMVTRSARPLYRGFWAQGGRYYLDYDELAPAFRQLSLRIVECVALVGLAGRAGQYLVQLKLGHLIVAVWEKFLCRTIRGLRELNPMRLPNRLVNEVTRRLDRLVPFWPVGHCLVLERDVQGSGGEPGTIREVSESNG